jgi:peroxiredoxin
VLGISVDTFAAANHFCEHMELRFPLLGDWPRNETGKAYGVFLDERSIHARTTFIVDVEGVVRARIDERDPSRHAPLALEAVRALRSG